MPYLRAHAPIYGYLRAHRHTIPLHIVHYCRTYSIFKLLSRLRFSSMLNVGGSEGEHSLLAQRLFGTRTVTTDLDVKALATGATLFGLETAKGDGQSLPFPDNSFDLAFCSEVIEHVPDPARLVAELKRVSSKYVLISTESYFESSQQRTAFLDYIRETHPQFFRAENPVRPGDIQHFLREDLERHLAPERPAQLSFFPQFRRKEMDMPGPIDAIRQRVSELTDCDHIDRSSRIIAVYGHQDLDWTSPLIPDAKLLAGIVTKEPLVPLERDAAMDQEDAEYAAQVRAFYTRYERAQRVVFTAAKCQPIAETPDSSYCLTWLTRDDLQHSPASCTRLIELAPGATTERRCHAWDHQMVAVRGGGVVRAGDDELDLSCRALVYVPPGVPFTVHAGPEGLDYLDIIPSVTQFFGR